jgi:CIC family chloride channel protein
MDYGANPVMQALRRAGVGSVMTRSFVRQGRHLDPEGARQLLAEKPEWVLVDDGEGPVALVPAVDLARETQSVEDRSGVLDLLEMPAHRLQVADIDLQATLQQALERLDETGADALYVQRTTAPAIKRIYGVLTRAQVESSYRY